jgi:hypothetical protein
MNRTSVQNGKQSIRKLTLRGETVRTLGPAELKVAIGGYPPGCTAQSNNQASTCPPLLNGDSPPTK